MCGIQHVTNVIDNTAISLANALSSIVVTASDRFFGGPAMVSKGFILDEALEIRPRAVARWPNLFKALKTAKLHQTMDKHKSVPIIYNNYFNLRICY